MLENTKHFHEPYLQMAENIMDNHRGNFLNSKKNASKTGITQK